MADTPDLAQEIERYEARLAKEPSSRIFAQLADAYRKDRRFDRAIQACLDGLKAHPTYVSARVVLGRSYLDKGALAEARAEFERVLDLAPDNLVAHRMLGEISERQGRPADAIKHYEMVVTLNPLDKEARELLASLRAPRAAPAMPASAPASAIPPEPEGEPTETITQPFAPEPILAPIEGIPPGPVEVAPQAVAIEEPAGFPWGEGPEGSVETAPETAPASRPATEDSSLFASETLADLYVQQGVLDRAREIYRDLLAANPSRADIEAKLAALERTEAVSAARGASATAGIPVPEPAAGAPRWPEGIPPAAEAAFGGDDGARFLTALEAFLTGVRQAQARARGR